MVKRDEDEKTDKDAFYGTDDGMRHRNKDYRTTIYERRSFSTDVRIENELRIFGNDSTWYRDII